VTEVGVHHDTQTLELVQIAVDGGEVHVGRHALYLFGQLFGGAVGAFVEETPKENAPRRGRATSTLAKQIEYFLDAVGALCHPFRLR
jgi:hypothetical protein